MNKQAIDHLLKRSEQITLLEKYSMWLTKNGYMDTDWKDEEPFAIDEFMKNQPRITKKQIEQIAEQSADENETYKSMAWNGHKEGFIKAIETLWKKTT